jgi:sugar lactone lactonase YvrE
MRLVSRTELIHPRRPKLERLAACLALTLACRQTEPSGATVAPTNHPAKAATPIAATSAPSPTPGPATLTGTVRVVSSDADALQRPTTAAFRGRTLWVSIGQLSALFSDGGQPKLPFAARSLTLSEGQLGASIELPGPDYYPEGIAAADDGTLYIGSIMQGVISKVPAGSTTAEPFLPRGTARRGVLGVTVDAPRQLLWFCDSNPKLEEAKKAGELVAVQLADAKEVVRHALPPLADKPAFCNDVIVSPDGALWITETAGGRVFRVPAEAALQPNGAQAWLTGGDVGPPPAGGSGPNGLVWMGGALFVANSGRGTLVRLDPRSDAPTRGAQVIALVDAHTRAPVTLCSPDGLERAPGVENTLIVVENGGCASKTPRISEVTLALGG